MKKVILFLVFTSAFLFCVISAPAALNFKMTADRTALILGGDPSVSQTKVYLWAHAESDLAQGQNGLNQWQLSVLADQGGIVQVDPASVKFLQPAPYSSTDTQYLSINTPDGSIEDLQTVSQNTPQDSATGIGGYSLIAEFVIQAIGEGTVAYTLGGPSFGGLLRDFMPFPPGNQNQLEGAFDEVASDRVFTVGLNVPEPSSLLLLSGMTWIASVRRKRSMC